MELFFMLNLFSNGKGKDNQVEKDIKKELGVIVPNSSPYSDKCIAYLQSQQPGQSFCLSLQWQFCPPSQLHTLSLP
jgi:hypothetical protein